jgi:AraC family transcriptional regulator
MEQCFSQNSHGGYLPQVHPDAQSILGAVAGREPVLRDTPLANVRQRVRGLLFWQVRKVVFYVEANLGRTIRVDDIATLAGLSPSHFSRAFKLTFEDTPYRYVLRRRMEKAKFLMRQSSDPLAEIALDVGCSDQSHFCRLFHSYMDQSPSEWRRDACAAGVKGAIGGQVLSLVT